MVKKNGSLCIVHNNIAEASCRLEVSEQRLIAYITSLINPFDDELKIFSIDIKEFQNIINSKRNDLFGEKGDICNITLSLQKKVMTLKKLDEPGFLQVSWLASADYKTNQGKVEIEISQKLKPYLLQLREQFLKYPLEDVIRFKSKYTMPIYLMLKQYAAKIHKRNLSINELREKLCLEENEYSLYGHLKAKVINVATKEINELTSLYVLFEVVKEGRKVTAIQFIINEKQPSIDEFEPVKDDIISQLTEYLSLKDAQNLLENYGEERCKNQLINLKLELKKREKNVGLKKIENPAGWLKSAMKDNYNSNSHSKKDEKPIVVELESVLIKPEEYENIYQKVDPNIKEKMKKWEKRGKKKKEGGLINE